MATLQRVKRPKVSLKDFAGIDSVKEEINEAITFLRNPKLFKEIGARPPRVLLQLQAIRCPAFYF